MREYLRTLQLTHSNINEWQIDNAPENLNQIFFS